MEGWRYRWSNTWWSRREWSGSNRGDWRRETEEHLRGPLQCWVNTVPVCIHRDKSWVESDGEEWGEVGADNTEKQGYSAFPSLLPFCNLASTKGCYVTAIYTRAPFPSHPPSHVRQQHMHTKCSSALLHVLFFLSLPLPTFLKAVTSVIIFPPEREFV